MLTPALGLCYGGDRAEMRALPGYESLMRTCGEHGIERIESVMSVTGGINVGAGALGLAFAAEPHEAEI